MFNSSVLAIAALILRCFKKSARETDVSILQVDLKNQMKKEDPPSIAIKLDEERTKSTFSKEKRSKRKGATEDKNDQDLSHSNILPGARGKNVSSEVNISTIPCSAPGKY